jgi:hypothetical protein
VGSCAWRGRLRAQCETEQDLNHRETSKRWLFASADRCIDPMIGGRLDPWHYAKRWGKSDDDCKLKEQRGRPHGRRETVSKD